MAATGWGEGVKARHLFKLSDVARIMRRALVHNDEPETVLAAIRDLRTSLEEMEARAVAQCVENGMSWAGIAQELGVSRQAVWARYATKTGRPEVLAG